MRPSCKHLSCALLFTSLLAAPVVSAETRRYAVVIGANIGDAQDARLRFAEADATKVAHTLRSVGEFPAAQTLQLSGVSADEVRRALLDLNARLRQDGADTVLLVYYSGHADADNLHLGGTHLGTRELRDILAGSSASSRVLIVDACRSGAVTRVKGGTPTTPFVVNLGELSPPNGLAIMTSSAEGEDSQESDALAGSFFTHYFNSGLIGAADQNRDGMVTLAEAFSFASEQTYRATVTTAAGPQHPTFRFDLGGRQDLVLARPRSPRQGLGLLQFATSGRYVVHRMEVSGTGPVVAEVEARTPGAQVSLPEGKYEVILRNPDHTLHGTAEVRDGAVASVAADKMQRTEYARLVRKGGEIGHVYSAVASSGIHTSAYELGGVGPIVGLSLRRDGRRFAFELRASWERSSTDSEVTYNSGVHLRTDTWSLTAAGVRAFDLGPVSVGGGIEAGVVLLHQHLEERIINTGPWPLYAGPNPGLRLPGQLSSSNTLGAVAGPMLQIDIRLLGRLHARVDASFPVSVVEMKDNRGLDSMTFGWRARVMGGIGCYF